MTRALGTSVAGTVPRVTYAPAVTEVVAVFIERMLAVLAAP